MAQLKATRAPKNYRQFTDIAIPSRNCRIRSTIIIIDVQRLRDQRRLSISELGQFLFLLV